MKYEFLTGIVGLCTVSFIFYCGESRALNRVVLPDVIRSRPNLCSGCIGLVLHFSVAGRIRMAKNILR